jgi:hypothetical protein
MALMRSTLAVLIALVLAAGCYGNSTPGPTPGSMDDVIAQLVLQNVTVHRLTSGDAGCPTSTLHDNAVHVELAIGAQSALHDVYLLRWRNQADYDAAAADFEACVEEFAAAHPGSQMGAVESAPWRVYGPFWTPQLDQIIRNALTGAGSGQG